MDISKTALLNDHHRQIAYSNFSVYGKFVQTFNQFPTKDLFIIPRWLQQKWGYEQSSWTYTQTLEILDALAPRYKEEGYGPGHRVALLLGNRPEHFFHWLALNSLGVSVVPINPDFQPNEARYLLEHSQSVLLVVTEEYRAQIETVAGELNIPMLGRGEMTFPTAIRAAPGGLDGEDAECALLYTSGTTSRPKGCILSNGYFFGFGEWYQTQFGLISLRHGCERLLQPLPTFHINAMANSFMGMLFTGGAQIILDRFHPRSWWQDAMETKATCFHYLGVMPAILLRLPETAYDRAHRMRFGMGGGVHPSNHAVFEERFGVPLLEGWTMTESGGGSLMCAMEEPRYIGERCIGCPDRNGPPLQARVVDDNGEDVDHGNPGELIVRAAGTNPRRRYFSGYWKNAEATEEIWRDGWLHTGDIVSAKTDGRLCFVDRKKNIIRRSGENIAAAEVEGVLSRHEAVTQVAVIAAADDIREEEVMAVIVLDSLCKPGPELAKELFAYCKENLIYYKTPGYVVFTKEIRTTSTQKLQKGELNYISFLPENYSNSFDFRSKKKRQASSQ